MIWLRIASSPPRTFYKDPDARAYLAAGESRRQLLESAGTLRSGTEGETPNVSVALRNESGQCSELFRLPPLGASAELIDPDGVVFAGIVREVSLGDGCELKIEA